MGRGYRLVPHSRDASTLSTKYYVLYYLCTVHESEEPDNPDSRTPGHPDKPQSPAHHHHPHDKRTRAHVIPQFLNLPTYYLPT